MIRIPLLRICTLFLIFLTVSCATVESKRTEYWHQRVSLFDELSISPDDIVFFGNSITDGGEFHELFNMPNIKNRGISGDNVSGLIERAGQITKGKPSKIFILIGINDIAQGHSVSQIVAEYQKLINKLQKETPDSKIYLQSVMPINNDFSRYKSLTGKEALIPALNKELEALAKKNNLIYIDLWPILAEPSTGKLIESYTPDGLHLSGKAYKVWTDLLLPYLNE